MQSNMIGISFSFCNERCYTSVLVKYIGRFIPLHGYLGWDMKNIWVSSPQEGKQLGDLLKTQLIATYFPVIDALSNINEFCYLLKKSFPKLTA